MYDVSTNTLRGEYHHKAAVLDCAFASSNVVFSGGLDQGVHM